MGVANWSYYTGAASYEAYFGDVKITVPTAVYVEPFSDPLSGWPASPIVARSRDACVEKGEPQWPSSTPDF